MEVNLSGAESLSSCATINNDESNDVTMTRVGAAITNMLNRPHPKVRVNRTVHCRCEPITSSSPDDLTIGIGALQEAFVGNGDLARFGGDVEGFEVVDVVGAEFAVTFRADDVETGRSSRMSDFVEQFGGGGGGASVTNARGLKFRLAAWLPRYRQSRDQAIVTLYPLPLEVSDASVRRMVSQQSWGRCERVIRGVYDDHPQWKSGYVHLCIARLNPRNIPPFLVVNRRRVHVSVNRADASDDDDVTIAVGANLPSPDADHHAAAPGSVAVKRRKLRKRTVAAGGAAGANHGAVPGSGRRSSCTSIMPRSSESTLYEEN